MSQVHFTHNFTPVRTQGSQSVGVSELIASNSPKPKNTAHLMTAVNSTGNVFPASIPQHFVKTGGSQNLETLQANKFQVALSNWTQPSPYLAVHTPAHFQFFLNQRDVHWPQRESDLDSGWCTAALMASPALLCDVRSTTSRQSALPVQGVPTTPLHFFFFFFFQFPSNMATTVCLKGSNY